LIKLRDEWSFIRSYVNTIFQKKITTWKWKFDNRIRRKLFRKWIKRSKIHWPWWFERNRL